MNLSLRRRGLRIRPLPSDIGPRAVADGHDAFGTPVEPFIDPEGGAPVRCCLSNSRPGDRLALISVAPEGSKGAYVERGPVFVHAEDCGGVADDGAYPEEWRARDQIMRAYGTNGGILGGELVAAGIDQEAAAERLLADPAVAFVQTRNVVFGCYMATITREDAS